MLESQPTGQTSAQTLERQRRLQDLVDNNYPKGHFVGFVREENVADSANFDELDSRLNELGYDPDLTLVIQSGDDLPDFTTLRSPFQSPDQT